MVTGREGKLPVMIIAAVLIVVLLAGVGVFVLKGRGGHKKGAEEKKPTVSLSLGEFVVNLADTGDIRYLKTNIVLAVSGEAPGGGGHGGESGPSPAVRDAVIQVLSGKCFAELNKPGGKDTLKKELIAAVNERLEGCKAVDVYFSDFAMQ